MISKTQKARRQKRITQINGPFYVQVVRGTFFFSSFTIQIQIRIFGRKKKKNIIYVQCLTRSWAGDKVLVKPFEQQTRE